MSARDAASRARLAAKVASRQAEDNPDDDDLFIAKLEADRALEIAVLEERATKRGAMSMLSIEEQKEQRARHAIINSAMARAKGSSKANPGQSVYKPDVADNPARRAIVHHTSSHYHMAGSKQFQLGLRVKGTVARHSRQGMRNGAAKQLAAGGGKAAQEAARGQRAQGAGGKKMKSKKGKKNRGGGGDE